MSATGGTQSRASGPMHGRRATGRAGLPATFVDILFCLVAVFMVSTLLGLHSYVELPQELMLPPLNLSELEADGAPESTGLALPDMIVVSIRPDSKGAPLFFIGDDEVEPDALGPILADSRPAEVCLRVDDDVRHGTAMSIVDLCRRSGVHVVSFAYEPTGSERR